MCVFIHIIIGLEQWAARICCLPVRIDMCDFCLCVSFTVYFNFLNLIIQFSVLLSDVDIVTLKNPFDYLEHDSDVEGMTDGFDPMAYMKLVVR